LRGEMTDLVRMGAYREGADRSVDEALVLGPRIEALLNQGRGEQSTFEAAFQSLREILGSA
jgi:flagellum-specific ATP synthase